MSETRRGSRRSSRLSPAFPSLPPRMLAVFAVLGTVVGLSLASSSAALAATGGPGLDGGTVFLSEVSTHGADVTMNADGTPDDTVTDGDWIEIHNTSTTTAEPIAGAILSDNDDTHSLTIPADTPDLPAGGYMAFRTDSGSAGSDGFSLGDVDQARLYPPGSTVGTTPVSDEFDWNHSPVHSWGRNFDASGDTWQATGQTTPNAANIFTGGSTSLGSVVINEVNMNGGPGTPGDTPPEPPGDWIELYNPSTTDTVTLTGAILSDSDDSHAYVIGTSPDDPTTLGPQKFVAIQVDNSQLAGNFGLGNSDSARLYPDSTLDLFGNGTDPSVETAPPLGSGAPTQDTTTWPNAMVFTWGRSPDGTGAFGPTAGPSAGRSNADPDPEPADSPLPNIAINEVKSTGDPVNGDWIELINTDTDLHDSAVDLSNAILSDDNAGNIIRIAPGVMLAPQQVMAFKTDHPDPALVASGSFGLGDADSARLFTAGALNLGTGPDAASPVDEFDWTQHATTSYGRPIGSIDTSDPTTELIPTNNPTFDAANDFTNPTDYTVTAPGVTPVDFSGLNFIQINEVESTANAGDQFPDNDWVELINTAPVAIDIQDAVMSDSDPSDKITLTTFNTMTPDGTMTLQPGAIAVVLTDLKNKSDPTMGDNTFGLGSNDSIELYDPGADPATALPIDHFEWTDHPAGSYQRQNNGLGDWLDCTPPSGGSPNPGTDCSPIP